MPLFLSTFVNKVDRKGRVSVPAPFRAALAAQAFQGIVLFCGHAHPCLEGFDYATMDDIGSRLDRFDLFSSEQDNLAATIFGDAVQLPFDAEGRIGLTDDLIAHAGLDESAAFVGLGRKFQIWSPQAWNDRRLQARRTVAEKGLTIPTLPHGKESA